MVQIGLRLFFIFIIIIACFKHSIQQQQRTKAIKTEHGFVRGEYLWTAQKNVKYSSFRGIPYASPPVGKLRFQPPEPPQRWNTILDTIQDPNPCAQYDSLETGTFFGSEDCLYLNVYTPEMKFNKRNLRAVMVWIHGGFFMYNSNNSSYYGPDFLIEKDVIVVAMNYRLGALGFLTLGTKDFSGNMGLKDQSLALKWVHKNIVRFGGDPDKVTIFGESAGAVAVELHHLSPLSQGLFRASIAMSGSPLNKWGFDYPHSAIRYSIQKIQDIVPALNVNSPEGISQLYNLKAEDLCRVVFMTNVWGHNITSGVPLFGALFHQKLDAVFQPTFELADNVSRPFLTKPPITLYKSGNYYRTPHILGYMKNEAAGVIPYKKALFAAGVVSTVVFERGIQTLRPLLTKKSLTPIYFYRNSFNYAKSLHNTAFKRNDGAAGHADDIAHIFYVNGKNQSLDPRSDIGRHRNRMVTMWTNFAKYLNPTYIRKNGVNVKWPPNNKNNEYLDISDTLKVKSDNFRIARTFGK